MNSAEKAAVTICSYEAYGKLVLDVFRDTNEAIVFASDTKETEITLKALHQFNLSRDKIIRQLADGLCKMQRWVRNSPGSQISRWLSHHGSKIGSAKRKRQVLEDAEKAHEKHFDMHQHVTQAEILYAKDLYV